jgi:hypothetical protein
VPEYPEEEDVTEDDPEAVTIEEINVLLFVTEANKMFLLTAHFGKICLLPTAQQVALKGKIKQHKVSLL